MARAQLTNNAVTTLSAGISNVVTSFTVAATTGTKFPAVGYFYVTVLDSANVPEIMLCTSRSVDIFTVTRAQDNTAARAFATGATVSLNITAAVIGELLDSAAAAATYATLVNDQNSTSQTLSSVTGADTITGNLTPAITSYVTGQTFRFVSAGANTGAVTLNVNGLGAKAVTKKGATALSATDIAAGAAIQVVYDGTQFQLTSGAGGGATGSGGDQVFFENDTTINNNHTITRNSHMVGPLTIASGKTLTINSGKRLVIL